MHTALLDTPLHNNVTRTPLYTVLNLSTIFSHHWNIWGAGHCWTLLDTLTISGDAGHSRYAWKSWAQNCLPSLCFYVPLCLGKIHPFENHTPYIAAFKPILLFQISLGSRVYYCRWVINISKFHLLSPNNLSVGYYSKTSTLLTNCKECL